MKLTASHAGRLQGQTSLELMIVEIPNISEYLDFVWYDRVWFKEDAGLGDTLIGKFLGPSHKAGPLLSYWIQPTSGIPVLRTTVQRVTYLEICTDSSKQRFEVYDKAIKERLHEKYNEEYFEGPNITTPTMDMWTELAEDDEDFQSEFIKLFDNPSINESDE